MQQKRCVVFLACQRHWCRSGAKLVPRSGLFAGQSQSQLRSWCWSKHQHPRPRPSSGQKYVLESAVMGGVHGSLAMDMVAGLLPEQRQHVEPSGDLGAGKAP
mmetsp:Transcript_107954/g.247537  ORF Transcript_107954/g.247537 Transcript_107954/m.247537 type:complete len:102 (-) Transcript_107954:265-570(-)